MPQLGTLAVLCYIESYDFHPGRVFGYSVRSKHNKTDTEYISPFLGYPRSEMMISYYVETLHHREVHYGVQRPHLGIELVPCGAGILVTETRFRPEKRD